MPELTPREIQQALAQPFAPEDLEWRLQNTIEDKMRGLAVPYVTGGRYADRTGNGTYPQDRSKSRLLHFSSDHTAVFSAAPTCARSG